MGVSKSRGIPKWMVYNGKPDDLGVTSIVGNTQIVIGKMFPIEPKKKNSPTFHCILVG